MATFNITGRAYACAIGAREVLVTYLYAIGSTAYICERAKEEGELDPVLISTVEFIKNVRTTYPASNSYFIFYNGTYYEGDLCSEESARDLAIIYWEKQEEYVLRQINNCS